MKECKYYFGDLVYIDFGYKKIVGEIESHRITRDGNVLYKIENGSLYVPSNMIHKLTEKQEQEHHDFVSKMSEENNISSHYEYIQQMQKAITWD